MTLVEEAERKLVGMMLLSRGAFLSVCERLKQEDFSKELNGAVFEELRGYYSQSVDDCIEVSEVVELVQKRTGMSYFNVMNEILASVDEVVTLQSLDWAIKKVLEGAWQRHLEAGMLKIQEEMGAAASPENISAQLWEVFLKGRREAGKVFTGPDMVEEITLRQERRRKSGDTIEGFRTGFPVIDQHLGGLVPGRLGILSGGYGEGKTSFAINWLVNVCVRKRVPSFYASLEMAQADVQDRMLAIIGDTSLHQIQSGAMNTTIYEAMRLIDQAPLYVSDNYPRDINDLLFMLEKYVRLHKIRFLVVDYIGELERDQVPFRKEERDERFSRWVKAIRDCGKRFQFHTLVLAQVNWKKELAESKKMAAHADYYLHIEREGKETYLEMRKNRFGRSNHQYAVRYDRETQRIEENGLRKKQED